MLRCPRVMSTKARQQPPSSRALRSLQSLTDPSAPRHALDFPRLTLVSGNSQTVHISGAALSPKRWRWARAPPSPLPQAFLQPLPLAALRSDRPEVALRQGEPERSPTPAPERGPRASLLSLPGVNGVGPQDFGTRTLTLPFSFSLVEGLKGPPVGSRDRRTRGQRGSALASLTPAWV